MVKDLNNLFYLNKMKIKKLLVYMDSIDKFINLKIK